MAAILPLPYMYSIFFIDIRQMASLLLGLVEVCDLLIASSTVTVMFGELEIRQCLYSVLSNQSTRESVARV